MLVAFFAWVMAALLAQQPVSSGNTSSSLDFEYFRTRVQPIFLAKREGHARCYACHSQGTPMRFELLSPGSSTWSEEESRKNFEAVRRTVLASDPMKSLLLRHALATEAGGDLYHSGGKHFESQDNVEWQVLAAWARGQIASAGK